MNEFLTEDLRISLRDNNQRSEDRSRTVDFWQQRINQIASNVELYGEESEETESTGSSDYFW
jgi:hypothetical protein